MKPVLIAVASAMFSTPLMMKLPPAPSAVPNHTAPARIHATDLGRLVWLAKADASGPLSRTEFAFARNETSPQIMVDPVQLRAGLARLMSASARSMSKSSRRSMGLRVTSASGRVVLELRDAGPGLSVQDLVAMYASDGSELSVARRRIERAGGVLNVSSEVGAGTVYLLEFPNAG